MRRKAIGAIALGSIAGGVLLALAWQASAAGGGNSGAVGAVVNTSRFMLFGGSYSVQGAQQPESAVFKIDSYTGETWILKVETASGKRTEKWSPIAGGGPRPPMGGGQQGPGGEGGRLPGGGEQFPGEPGRLPGGQN